MSPLKSGLIKAFEPEIALIISRLDGKKPPQEFKKELARFLSKNYNFIGDTENDCFYLKRKEKGK